MEHPKNKILVVEDVSDWRLTLKGMLEEANFDVNTVDSFEDARKILDTTHFDAALLDIRLDESDENNVEGLKLAEEISIRWPEIKVFIATGYTNEEYIKRALEPSGQSGKKLAIDFIKKSDVDKLVVILNQALKK